MSPALQWQRDHWCDLLKPLNQQLLETMVWFKAQSKADAVITRLRTHPGIGLLTALCLWHTLQPVSRFRNQRQIVAYAGLDSDGAFLSRAGHLSGHQQSRVPDAALPVSGSSPHRD